MHLLHGRYDIALPCLDELARYNYVVYSAIDRTVPCRIWVDDLENPRLALLWDMTSCSGIYVGGECTPGTMQAVAGVIREEIYPEARRNEEMKDFALCFCPGAWEEGLMKPLSDLNLMVDSRKFLTFDKGANSLRDWRPHIPPDTHLLKVDAASDILETDLENVERLAYELEACKDGFGCCLMDRYRILSWCTSDWHGQKHVEIHVHTDPDHQGKGYGTLVAAAMVEHALERGYEHIGWHCWNRNTASERTALKAGFVLEREHPVIHAWFKELDNMLVNANFHLEHGEYSIASKFLDDAGIMIEKGRKRDLAKWSDLPAEVLRRWRLMLKARVDLGCHHFSEVRRSLMMIMDIGCDAYGIIASLDEEDGFEEFMASDDGKAVLRRIEGI
jgi:RimJ/RimL family protein N-acetyltransferase